MAGLLPELSEMMYIQFLARSNSDINQSFSFALIEQ